MLWLLFDGYSLSFAYSNLWYLLINCELVFILNILQDREYFSLLRFLFKNCSAIWKIYNFLNLNIRFILFFVLQENRRQKGRVHNGEGENASEVRGAHKRRRNAGVSQTGPDLQREQNLQVRKCIICARPYSRFWKTGMFLYELSARHYEQYAQLAKDVQRKENGKDTRAVYILLFLILINMIRKRILLLIAFLLITSLW